MTSAVVVGSGPNGLAAALTLAEAGVSVRLIEAADDVGGGLRSAELTLPGLVHDECAGFHPFATSSRFARRHRLDEVVTWRWPEHQFAHPLDGGRGAVLDRSVESTAAALGRDGASWRRMFGPLTDAFGTVSDEFLQPILHLPRHPLQLARFGAYAAMPATALTRRWRDEPARALFAGVAAHSFTRHDIPFSAAAGVALTTAAHAFGWPVAEGGSGAFARALLQRCTEAGVQVETGRRVRSLDELGPADVVMLDTTPGAAADIVGDLMPPRAQRAYRRYRHGPAAFKVDFAVADGVPWAYGPARRAGTLHVSGGAAETAAAEAGTNRGRLAERPFVLVGQQWLADPTRSRDGAHPLYAYAHVPSGYDGPPEVVVERITAQIERFAPGFRDRILATHVRTPAGLERHNPNWVGGDIATGAADVAQMLFRPRLTLHPYRTGVPGVFLCSAATPPGAGAHGMCGHLAAQDALSGLSRGCGGTPARGRAA